jgi:hypothetical protein
MKNRWSMAALVILAGALALSLALAPSAALAKQYVYPGTPAFTVTYPDAWEQSSDNPSKVTFRTKMTNSLPTMDVNVLDLEPGTTVNDLGNKVYKKRLEKLQMTSAAITSNNLTKLKDGTPAVETVYSWMYQGIVELQSSFLGTIKGGKFIYVVIHQYPGEPMWDAPRSLTFK